jgi:acetolactate synthase I/II/III large subunit
VRAVEAVGRAVAAAGADTAFGVVGSGNFHLTNAMVAAGMRYVPARHEGGAATMADAYARISGRLGVLTVHQGPGLTNAMTGIAEAAKSRTPLLVLAAATGLDAVRSNFRVDQAALAEAVGAVPMTIHSGQSAVDDLVAAVRVAVVDRRTVLLNLPLDVQAEDAPAPSHMDTVRPAGPVAPSPGDVAALAELIGRARRPVFLAGRGGRGARAELVALADRAGALLATSAVARGLFAGHPYSLDVSGGFASPLAAELIAGADLLVGWGCALNMWTTRHGRLVGPGTTVAQVDLDADALGAHHRVDLGVVGDAATTATAVAAALRPTPSRSTASGSTASGGAAARPIPPGAEPRGYRTEARRERIAGGIRWRDVPYDDDSTGARIDPRTLSIALDDLLPAERTVAVDSGNFMGYPSMFLSVPDQHGFCFTQAYQSIGLGLATAIGAAVARPDRLTVAALGDGGALMGIAELETAVRLRLPLIVVIYNDHAYGAEVHHFGPDGHPLGTVVFPETDIAAIGRGFGCDAATVHSGQDLDAVALWLRGDRDRPLLIDAKVTAERGSWWLTEAFRGH